MGTISVETRDGEEQVTSTDRLIIGWTDSLTAASKVALESAMTEWLRIRWPSAEHVDVSIEAPEVEP